MKYDVRYSTAFKKGLKKLTYQPKKIKAVHDVVQRLAAGEVLEEKYRDHKLSGDFQGRRECHVLPDLLLIYEKDDDILILHCVAVGSHSELF